MNLSDATLPAYLRDHRLLRGRRVDAIRSTIRRSYCAEVSLSDGAHWFVKQARLDPAGDPLADLGREAAVLRWAEAGGADHPLRPVLPPFLLHDAPGRVLITGYLGAHSPLARARSRSLLGRRTADALAAHLARIHAVSRDAVPWADALPVVLAPPVAAWEDVRPETIAAQPDAFAELLGHLQDTPGLAESVARLRAGWSPGRLVHGDLKRDNVLLRPRRAGTGAGADLRIIDWELAHWGDPAWDVGSAIGDYVQGWLETISPTRSGGLADWIAAARVPYPRVQAAVAAFWTAYRDRSGLLVADGDAARVVAAAGIFLVHRAMGAVLVHGTLTSGALCTLQVARRFLGAPDAAAQGLLP